MTADISRELGTERRAWPRVSLVIPFLDEAENVNPILEEVFAQAWVAELGERFEVLCVDDGSTDATLSRLEAWLPKEPRLRVIGLPPLDRGKSRALTAGFRAARGEWILTMDGDRQNDPADLAAFLAALETSDVVAGVRGRERKGLLRRAMSSFGNGIRNWALGESFGDVACGLKGFRREVVLEFPAVEGVHRFFLTLARVHGHTVTELPVSDRPRAAGAPKYGAGRVLTTAWDLLSMVWYQRRYRSAKSTTDSGV